MTDHNPDMLPTDVPVDLTNCDREPIHILGRVQSFGALISVSPDWIINHASENIDQFIGTSAADLVGMPMLSCFPEAVIHDIRTRLQLLASPDAVERVFHIPLTGTDDLFDLAIHRSGRSIVIELERHVGGDSKNYTAYVRSMIDRIGRAKSAAQLCDLGARQLRALIGFDRVMVYKFLEDESGEVVAEAVTVGQEPFKGLRYPASDIPKQARELYKRNLLRIISDVSDPGHAIVPPHNPDGEPLDLSMSATRAVSPIHVEYLKNMGVHASMSISILKRGKLWGMFACHHNAPRILPYDVRTAAELFCQLFSFVLDQRENDELHDKQTRGHMLHDQIMAQLAEGSTISDSFELIISAIEPVIPYDGVVGWVDGAFVSRGMTPTQDEFTGLARFLNTTATSRVFATDCISRLYPAGADFAERAAGLLVLPVSRTPRDYIILFRQELARTVQWAGNPQKPVETGPNGSRLTPRKSFEAWQEIVRHHSGPWTEAETNAADALRITLLEVILRMSESANKERAKAQERQEILIAELNHRVRNILNLIRGLVTQSTTETRSVSEFTEVIGGRIHALARAHDQITKKNWSPASLQDMIGTEASAYLGDRADRMKIDGVDPHLTPDAFTTMSLVIHELITNSAKYGALSNSTGRIEIALLEAPDGALDLRWREQGGPPIKSPPVRRGFGSTIIERSIPFELQGEAAITFDVSGLQADFMIPPRHVAHFVRSGAVHDMKPVEPTRANRLSGDALIVEDNMIIALDAEDFLSELGAEQVHIVSNVKDALAILDTTAIRFALLDVNLGSETSELVAQRLAEDGTRFAFASGYGDSTDLSKRFPNAPMLQKPYDKASFVKLVRSLI